MEERENPSEHKSRVTVAAAVRISSRSIHRKTASAFLVLLDSALQQHLALLNSGGREREREINKKVMEISLCSDFLLLFH